MSKFLSLASLARSMPSKHEMDRVITRMKYIKGYQLYTVYKDCLDKGKTEANALEEFILRCKNLGLGRFNTIMFFYYQYQPVLPRDDLWVDMISFLKANGYLSDGLVTEGKFYSDMIAIKWIIGYRFAQSALLEDMNRLNYDTNWKAPDTSL